MKSIRCVYIAGPYRGDTAVIVKRNIRMADIAGEEVASMGALPVIPHKNTENYEGLQGPQWFVDATFELMQRCDAILVVPGSKFESSTGTMGEIKGAKKIGIPIFYTYSTIRNWLADDKGKPGILQRIRKHFYERA